MKKLAIAAIACAIPLTASAKGWGFTSHGSNSYSANGYYSSQFNDLPSIDIRQAGWVIQLDALDLLHGFASETVDADGDESRDLHFGLNAYKTTDKQEIHDHLGGVMQPGFSIDLDTNLGTDPMLADVQFQMRLGARSQKPGGMGIGIYVVPGVGFAKAYDFEGDDAMALSVSGDLQISVWRNN
jgi:hypothetical protein